MIIFNSLVGSLYATGDFQSREVAKQLPFLQAEAASPTSLFVFGGANDDTGTMNAGVAIVANSVEAVSPAFQKMFNL